MEESHCPTGIAVKKTGVKQFDTNYRKQTLRFIFRQLAKDRVRRGPVLLIRIRLRIHRIHMFLGLLDPDPDTQVRGMDPEPDPGPSIIKQKK
jgi:hypothetical protein